MRDKSKKNKASRGRHSADAVSKAESQDTQELEGAQEPVETPADEAPEADAAPTEELDTGDTAASTTGEIPVQPAPATQQMTQAIPMAPAAGVPGAGRPAGFAPSSTGSMQPIDMGPAAGKKKSRAPKVLGIIFGVLLALAAVAYVAGAVYFMDRFFPNTTVGKTDISLQTTEQVKAMLEESADDYSLSVSGYDFSLAMTPEDLGFSLDADEVVAAMRADENPWAWPIELMSSRDEADNMVASYNKETTDATVRAAVEEHNATATPSTNATIGYDAATGRISVIPETYGTVLDPDAMVEAVDTAVVSLQPTVKLSEEQLVAPTLFSSEPGLRQAADQANTMVKADMVLMMGPSVAAEVNAELISTWITVGEDYNAHLDEGLLTAWVDQLAAACNTLGSERTYTRPDGKVVTVSGGSYGFEVDRDALHNLVTTGVAAGSVETVDVPCTQTAYAYNGAGAQDWGSRYVDVDLAEQYARFYDDSGALVWETSIISGKPTADMATPTGVYVVNSKASPTTLYTYEAGQEKPNETVVQYWMPFVGNTVGLHDAWWQPGFGGSMYSSGYGSHGCVNLPSDKAASLYGMIYIGDVVVVHW